MYMGTKGEWNCKKRKTSPNCRYTFCLGVITSRENPLSKSSDWASREKRNYCFLHLPKFSAIVYRGENEKPGFPLYGHIEKALFEGFVYALVLLTKIPF